MGAAVAGAYAFLKSEGEEIDVEQFGANLLIRGEARQPMLEDVSAIHGPDGYLDKFAAEEAKLVAAHSLN